MLNNPGVVALDLGKPGSQSLARQDGPVEIGQLAGESVNPLLILGSDAQVEDRSGRVILGHWSSPVRQ